MTSMNAAVARLPGPPAPVGPLRIYWALATGGLTCFLLAKMLGEAGPISALLALIGTANCGLSWLLVRALFRPDAVHALWPRIVVGSMFATAILIKMLSGTMAPAEVASPLRRVLQNVDTLASSTVLLLGLVDTMEGYRAASKPERRFRLMFAAGYAGLVFIAVIMLRQSSASAATSDLIKGISAFLAGAGGTLAVAYRIGNPLPSPAAPAPKRRAPSAADKALGERIRRLVESEDVYTRPDFKVADLARLAGEPDYKVTQCITGVLGFANFNRMINQHRIALAKRQLSDPALRDRPILTIAIDCGFASIGPFNRAFKEMVGTTPSMFRERGGFGAPEAS